MIAGLRRRRAGDASPAASTSSTLPVPDLDQTGVLEVLEHTLHARALRTEHRGQLCLGDLDQSRAARGPQEVRGHLRFEATGEQVDQPRLQPRHALGQRHHPTMCQARARREEPEEFLRVQREQARVRDGARVERFGLSQERRDVTEHIPGPQDLQHDAPSADHARQLDLTRPQDVDPRRGVTLTEDERTAGMGLLTDLGDEHGDVVLTDRRPGPASLTLGPVGDESMHEAILREVLEAATGTQPAGTIVPLDHRWPDDLRTRQLRKKAH